MIPKLLIIALLLGNGAANAQYIADTLPTPSSLGRAHAASGGQIVGDAFGAEGGPTLWDGSPPGYVDLTPLGFDFVTALAVGAGIQGGYGMVNGTSHALIWAGTAKSVVDLHHDDYLGSGIYGIDDTNGLQVGVGGVSQTQGHALLWDGDPTLIFDLHPGIQFSWSAAYGASGGVQVGSAENTPVIWHGSASTIEVLPTPKGNIAGTARAIHGNQVVGGLSDEFSAALWDIEKWTIEPLGQGHAFDTNGIHQVGERGPLGKARAPRTGQP